MSWGNISTRYAWQRAKEQIQNGKSKFQLNGFTSRLRWQAHFIQKFEMECQMEFRSVNKGYQNLVKPINKVTEAVNINKTDMAIHIIPFANFSLFMFILIYCSANTAS